MQSTADVLQHHLDSFGSGDLDGILSDYTDDSVFIGPDGTVLKGIAQLKGLFEQMFAEFAKPGAFFSIDVNVVDGDLAYIVWHGESADNVYELGTDTFLVQDGNIVRQTFAAKATPKG